MDLYDRICSFIPRTKDLIALRSSSVRLNFAVQPILFQRLMSSVEDALQLLDFSMENLETERTIRDQLNSLWMIVRDKSRLVRQAIHLPITQGNSSQGQMWDTAVVFRVSRITSELWILEKLRREVTQKKRGRRLPDSARGPPHFRNSPFGLL